MCRTLRGFVLPTVCFLAVLGCRARNVDFAEIQRPPRSAELDAYNVFVGTWDWQAEMLNAEGPDRNWTGTAEWKWALDNRCLEGKLRSTNQRATFEANGVWTWHPLRKRYQWWMFNDWGYPQQGNALYDAETRTWRMPYRSVGLDGTRSFGEYSITAVDNDTLEWCAEEWVGPLHTIKKFKMVGTYKRKK